MVKMLSGWSIVVHSSAVEDHVKNPFKDAGGLDSNPGDGVGTHCSSLMTKIRFLELV